ncbi:MAG: hypothetical protein A2977_03745 [Alphaproteobacteria bacterium RIFCSPLOWO2_01_FULL_45_8]|nr:MAG: hypothetical protein A2065_03255 [Alphaproteobacteria bacterium GWB1_45_5]OFW76588.1 MAG: hypothetical protein A3K20_00180 [Alphaproteobacteria bacterium GWA1_45_9]OFW89672.1 MAG: hypothetical protein A2621_02070 [Alphaproteobacteria bacterium RIFCSPHIGHO2_01_FULL_41_14]OFW95829.1 MAG: hypothetical protein A2977_03745 [Alphaproteobacteria bacterium RIFCSPLOWO2_01_FULL_45_8]HCI49114.1 hypothetical protein [Holosporales bacterium]
MCEPIFFKVCGLFKVYGAKNLKSMERKRGGRENRFFWFLFFDLVVTFSRHLRNFYECFRE